MNSLQNAHPRLVLEGWDDQSTRSLPIDPEPLPMHLPLFFTFAERGPEHPALVSGVALENLVGAKTLDVNSKFVTHQTPFIRATNSAANAAFVHRLCPDDAKTATMTLSLDIVATELPIYERNDEGFIEYDTSGAPIPTGETTPGFVGKWVITPLTGAVAARTTSTGSLEVDGVQSTLYPVADIVMSSKGAWGNNVGLRFSAPTTLGEEPIDVDLALSELAYIFRMQVVEKPDPRTSPVLLKTLANDPYVDFTIRPGTTNTNFDSALSAEELLPSSFRDLEDVTTGVPAYGPFEKFHFYDNHVKTISKMVYDNEVQVNDDLPVEDGAEWLINLFSATNLDGTQYHSLQLHGSLDNEPELTDVSTHYAMGGDDGDLSAANFEVLVKQQLDNFGDLDVQYRDMAKFPLSCFYDSGFSLEVKKSIPRLMGIRQDMHVALATQDVALPQLKSSEETSMAIALRSQARMYPESTIYGTPTARAVIVAQSGYMVNSNYRKLVPGTLELCIKRARYMGASNGVMKGTYSYTVKPYNHLSYLRDLNNLWVPTTVRNKNWDAGLIWAQNYDTTRQFYPAFQTVYDDPTSVLNSDVNMQIATELNKVCFRVWRDLTGNDTLSKAQFIQRSNELIVEYTKDRFDGRVVIVPDTFFTQADDQRGFSWHCRIHMYANVMKTVSISTVVTHRLEDLQ